MRHLLALCPALLLLSVGPAFAGELPECPRVCPLGEGEATGSPEASPGTDGWIYAYAASGSTAAIPTWPWASVTHVALAGVELKADGSIETPGGFADAVQAALEAAKPHGVEVHVNLYTPHPALLDDPAAVQRAAAGAGELLTRHDLQGVSIDVEGLSRSSGPRLTALIEAVAAVSPTTVVAAPAAFLTDMGAPAWATKADALMIMAYQYYGDEGPAPISPRRSSSSWPGGFGVEDSVDCYRCRGVSPGKLVVGLPLYGGHWTGTDNEVPSSARSRHVKLVDFGCIVADARDASGGFDEASGTAWYFPDTTSQAWYDTVDSLTAKMSAIADHGLKGVGFWQLANAEACQNEPYRQLWTAVGATIEAARPPKESELVDPAQATPTTEPEPDGCGCASTGRAAGGGLLSLLLLWGMALLRAPGPTASGDSA